jgi:hypothetical protein
MSHYTCDEAISGTISPTIGRASGVSVTVAVATSSSSTLRALLIGEARGDSERERFLEGERGSSALRGDLRGGGDGDRELERERAGDRVSLGGVDAIGMRGEAGLGRGTSSRTDGLPGSMLSSPAGRTT